MTDQVVRALPVAINSNLLDVGGFVDVKVKHKSESKETTMAARSFPPATPKVASSTELLIFSFEAPSLADLPKAITTKGLELEEKLGFPVRVQALSHHCDRAGADTSYSAVVVFEPAF